MTNKTTTTTGLQVPGLGQAQKYCFFGSLWYTRYSNRAPCSDLNWDGGSKKGVHFSSNKPTISYGLHQTMFHPLLTVHIHVVGSPSGLYFHCRSKMYVCQVSYTPINGTSDMSYKIQNLVAISICNNFSDTISVLWTSFHNPFST